MEIVLPLSANRYSPCVVYANIGGVQSKVLLALEVDKSSLLAAPDLANPDMTGKYSVSFDGHTIESLSVKSNLSQFDSLLKSSGITAVIGEDVLSKFSIGFNIQKGLVGLWEGGDSTAEAKFMGLNSLSSSQSASFVRDSNGRISSSMILNQEQIKFVFGSGQMGSTADARILPKPGIRQPFFKSLATNHLVSAKFGTRFPIWVQSNDEGTLDAMGVSAYFPFTLFPYKIMVLDVSQKKLFYQGYKSMGLTAWFLRISARFPIVMESGQCVWDNMTTDILAGKLPLTAGYPTPVESINGNSMKDISTWVNDPTEENLTKIVDFINSLTIDPIKIIVKGKDRDFTFTLNLRG